MGAERSDAPTEPVVEPDAGGGETDPLLTLSDELRAEMEWSVAQFQQRATEAQARLAQAQADANEAQGAAFAAQQRMATQLPAKPPPGRWELYPGPAYLEELEQAADTGIVSFSQTFLALQIATDPRGPETVTQRVRELEPELLRAFQSSYGTIIESRYAEAAAAGAVLLGRIDDGRTPADAPPEEAPHGVGHSVRLAVTRGFRRVFTGSPEPPNADPAHTPRAADMDALVMWHWLNFDSQDATNMLSDALNLRDRITTFLRGEEPREKDARDIAVRRVYGIARELMSAVDWEEHLKRLELEQGRQPDRRPSSDLSSTITNLRARMTTTQTSYLAAIQRVAQNQYLIGMFTGLVIGAVALSCFAVITDLVGFTAAWLAASVGGVVGATLSVLQRMSRGLDLGPEGEKQSFRQQGLARPLIGMLLGLASYVLLKGGIVAFTTPKSSGDQVLYYAGIAFLAGFSERFAQDMLVAPTRTGTPPVIPPTPPKPS